ncbi:hypothetical protein N2152v2_006914 [Parachlorella kessleri]
MEAAGTSWVVREAPGRPRYRYRKRSRTICEQATESYLRVDISCGSQACGVCRATLPCLSAQASHYLIPDRQLLHNFQELFESPEVGNVIYLASVVRPLLEGGNMRRSVRLRGLYSDKRRCCCLFDNVHHRDTAAASGPAHAASGEDLLAAADWYYEHLGRALPIVIVSDSLASRLGVAASAPIHAAIQPGGKSSSASAGIVGAAWTAERGTAQHSAADSAHVDDDLEALLRQLDIAPSAGHLQQPQQGSMGSSWGPGAPAPAAAQVADEGELAFLESLGFGASLPAPAAPAVHRDDGSLPLSAGNTVAAAAAGPGRPPGKAGAKHGAQLAPGVHVMPAADYFDHFYRGSPGVLDVFESRVQSLAEAKRATIAQQVQGGSSSSSSSGYKPHLSVAAVDAGLSQGSLLQGVLSISRRSRDEGSVRIGGGGGVAGEAAAQHVLISGRAALNRAMHGDTVAVRLLPRGRWRPAKLDAELDGVIDDDEDVISDDADLAGLDEQGGAGPLAADVLNNSVGGRAQPTGEVVAVVQRGPGEVVATISEEDERALTAKGDTGRQEAVLVIPLDRRLPKVRLRSRQLHRLLGARLVVRVDGWDRGSNYPHGHLLRVLGPVNDLTAETDAVLVSSGVHWEPFTEGALRELPPVADPDSWQVPPAELASRRDLRGPEHFVCSIDPPGCVDVDDALSVRWLGDGSVEVGVHIADVSHFVRQGSLLDAEAASRCTTVYLVDRRLDMLPALLSEHLCSLRGGRDRLAVSVLWTLREADLAVQTAWFGRTIIRSRYQLEYQQAQDIMEGAPTRPGHEISPADRPTLQRALRFLSRLAASRRGARLAEGAVELESAELRFRTDKGGQPVEVDVKQGGQPVEEIPMMRIVAEMMIFANAAVAERTFRAFPRAALLRRHPPPRRDGFAEVLPLCESVGVELDFSSNAALSAGLEAAAAAAPPGVATLIKSLTTRAMSEAEYFCTGDVMGRGAGMSHFGLALPFYTHFTSPIRRYADVVVHRQVLAAVAAGGHLVQGEDLIPPPDLALLVQQAPPPLPPSEVSSKTAVMNERHRAAKRAQHDCSDLYLLLLLHSAPHVEAATIYGLRGSALLLFVPKYHLKGVVHLVDASGVPKPPLRQPGDENLQDAFVLASRRAIAVLPGEDGIRLVDTNTGGVVAEYHRMQRVWVELGADGSRAHGPALRMRLLADSHPAALEAAARQLREAPREGPAALAGAANQICTVPAAGAAAAAAAGAVGMAGVSAGRVAAAGLAQQARQPGGCGALPRGTPRPGGGYRPPGLGKPPAGAAAQQQQQQQPESTGAAAGSSSSSGRGPPPGFPAASGGAPAAGTVQQEQLQHLSPPEQASSGMAPAAAGGGTGAAAAEDHESSQAGTDMAFPVAQPLVHISQPRTAVPIATLAPQPQQQRGLVAEVSAAGSSGSMELLLSAVRRLRARVSRYALRAAELDPAGARAREWAVKARGCQEQLAQLERHLGAFVLQYMISA